MVLVGHLSVGDVVQWIIWGMCDLTCLISVIPVNK